MLVRLAVDMCQVISITFQSATVDQLHEQLGGTDRITGMYWYSKCRGWGSACPVSGTVHMHAFRSCVRAFARVCGALFVGLLFKCA